MLCPVPGTHRIQPILTAKSSEDGERYLSVKADVNCFLWHLHQNENSLLGAGETQLLGVWIFDPENTKNEMLIDASSPDIYSSTLSKQFWNLGQVPTIRTLFGTDEHSSISFLNGEWIFEVPSQPSDNMATIHGKALAFQDCFVLDTPFTIALPQYILGSDAGVSVTRPAGREAVIAWSACYPRSAVIATTSGIFHTSNGFLTTREIKFPAGLVDSTMIHKVKDVAVVYPDVLILIGNIVYKASIGNVINIGEHHFPGVKIIGMHPKTWCPGNYPLGDRKLSEIIIWAEDKIFLGHSVDELYPLVDTTLLRELLKMRRTVTLLIITACYDSLITSVAVLVECTGCGKKKVLYLATYKEDTSEWVLTNFNLILPTAGTIHMEVILSAESSLVIWNDDIVFYTYLDHTVIGYLQISGTKRKFSAASEGSKIHQIIIDYDKNTIIKLENNALFFFKFEIADAVKLTSWENDHFVFYFNPFGDMYLLTINGTNIQRDVYPLKLEVLDVATKLKEVCPYIAFEHNLNNDVYYVDMRENVTFWGQIVFVENLGLSISIEIYRPKLLQSKSHVNYEIARGICTKYLEITFYHNTDYSELYPYEGYMAASKGVMTIEFQPSESGKTCISNSKLSHISIGCPPGKKIVVEKKPLNCENFTFTIPWKLLRDQKHKRNLEIRYDIEKYGCPIPIHYKEKFRPDVQLYRDGKMTPVEANYVLWEMNKRTDFSYSATMEEVYCLYVAQNWELMIDSYDETVETTEDIDKVWGPHNYRSCFVERFREIKEMDHPYEILNRSGINFLTWPYHTGVYMFRLTILDPNYSFCKLTAYFAVQTYGVTERPNWIKVVGWSTMLIGAFWAFLIFSYFRYVRIFRSFPFVDPLQSPSSNALAGRPDDGLKRD